MPRYSVGGRSANTAATADHAASALWNASTAKSIFVAEIWCFKITATVDNHQFSRTTGRGTTPGSTVTPDIDNDFDHAIAPVSGALLDLAAWGTPPTLSTPTLARTNLPAAVGAGYIMVFSKPIQVKQSTGLAVATPTAVILISADFTYVWDE